MTEKTENKIIEFARRAREAKETTPRVETVLAAAKRHPGFFKERTSK